MSPGTLAVQLYSVIDALEADRPGSLARLAALGFRHVEPFALGLWNTPPAELAATARALRADLDEAGLGVGSVHIAVQGDSQAAAVEVCRILGTDTAFVPIPWLVDGFDERSLESHDGVRAFAGRLNEAARELAGAGIRLGYHNHHFEWARLPGGAHAFDVLWDLLDPEVLAEVDVYWAAVAGQDPAEVLKRLGERAVAAHVKDGPAVLDTAQTPIGTGDIDIPAALRAGTHLRWHITEIDRAEADRFELLAANRQALLAGGLTVA
ncbi:sugar phosphate isomerase/epimerase [Streptomyces sp. MBT53]|uniref:sugar phosphate isomerase/epimerase family protein n=1 Tax=Streptomyces sp. MBT53 TaxID=1488384 RepID=UPI001912738C|nr:sugar phosphate isomerase/epimerase [Streptomyces sp. MBT53]MBK6016937.1 sugar phosphate isomerase/epimerase [Streptomyces sp. MBT53]